MTIRTARDTDRAAIASVQTESWQDTYADQLPAAYRNSGLEADLHAHWKSTTMEPGDLVLVSETDGAIEGFIAVWCRPDPFIDNLHVRPAARSGGLGAALMREAARRLRGAGHDSAFLWVVADNTAAVRFYERLGGTITRQAEKDLFGHQALHLKVEWSALDPLADR